jgi:hypothetical protein
VKDVKLVGFKLIKITSVMRNQSSCLSTVTILAIKADSSGLNQDFVQKILGKVGVALRPDAYPYSYLQPVPGK